MKKQLQRKKIAVKCYIDDDKVEVYLVAPKTSLSTFEKMLRRELHSPYRVHLLDSPAPVSSSEWAAALAYVLSPPSLSPSLFADSLSVSL